MFLNTILFKLNIKPDKNFRVQQYNIKMTNLPSYTSLAFGRVNVKVVLKK